MKVLIADDEAEVREVLRKILQSANYEVIECVDGQAALDHALQQKPDLLILDVLMPKLTGWEVCRELKRREETKNIPVIILTAKSKAIDELMTAEAGANLYIKKPFDPLALLHEVKKLLGDTSTISVSGEKNVFSA